MNEETSVDAGSEDSPLNEQPQDWKESLPEDLRDAPALQSFTDIPNLAKGYVHLSSKLGANKLVVPDSHTTEEEWENVYTQLGRPETPGDYDFSQVSQGEDSKDFEVAWAEQAHQLGLLPHQASGVLDFLNRGERAAMEEIAQQNETSRMDAEQALRKEWGAKYNENLSRIKNLISGFGESTAKAFDQLGNNVEFLKGLDQIAQMVKEDEIPGKLETVNNWGITFDQAEKRKAEIYDHPGYMDKTHPNHNALMAELEKMWQVTHTG